MLRFLLLTCCWWQESNCLQFLEARNVLVSNALSLEERSLVRETLQATTGFPHTLIETESSIRGLPDHKKFILTELELGCDALDILAAALDNQNDEKDDAILCLGAGSKANVNENGIDTAALAYIRHYSLIDAIHSSKKFQIPKTKVTRVLLDGEKRNNRFDMSEICVVDGLVDADLRRRIRKECLGGSTFPNSVWIRGGLSDTVKPGATGGCWGLTPKALDALCQAPAVQELEHLVVAWLENANNAECTVTRMPAAVFGDEISPITANAPVSGDIFDYHIDADPFWSPPSPWRDFFGAYVNRDPGKPRFVSALFYLSEPPFGESYLGASTSFLDTPTGATCQVLPIPGRLVLLDQDITHAVSAPTEAAGKNIPRFSLVVKLVIHPGSFGHPLLIKKAKQRRRRKIDHNENSEIRPSPFIQSSSSESNNTVVKLVDEDKITCTTIKFG
eukprot:CAMPEP_0197321022 /NCGR_PEP_ID=MMETSP0891-20130614/62748_1 /TAXON_ID=44058 ORGANISM="Aureoumbra lagunensis, Strain CCMP1510" /NCGR_SAMPLE_ID=MMETSP0891 /ASSEMBLY_ACC=CAM_ASM_000534 /LENGTH=447 /DNA_ID=CAMNT_0042812665 /DNA_START=46 /DNA_END=1385 /DNA_ORIENTATION=+